MIVDTSVLLAYFDSNEPSHGSCADVIESATDALVVSPYVIAELDYLIATRIGARAEQAALTELSSGAWELAAFPTSSLQTAVSVLSRYEDQTIGLADASMVVLADTYRTRTIATLDRRRFGVLRPMTGGRFRVLP